MPSSTQNRLGVVTSGSFMEGLSARLAGNESVEDMRVGKFVVIDGHKHAFFRWLQMWC